MDPLIKQARVVAANGDTATLILLMGALQSQFAAEIQGLSLQSSMAIKSKEAERPPPRKHDLDPVGHKRKASSQEEEDNDEVDHESSSSLKKKLKASSKEEAAAKKKRVGQKKAVEKQVKQRVSKPPPTELKRIEIGEAMVAKTLTWQPTEMWQRTGGQAKTKVTAAEPGKKVPNWSNRAKTTARNIWPAFRNWDVEVFWPSKDDEEDCDKVLVADLLFHSIKHGCDWVAPRLVESMTNSLGLDSKQAKGLAACIDKLREDHLQRKKGIKKPKKLANEQEESKEDGQEEAGMEDDAEDDDGGEDEEEDKEERRPPREEDENEPDRTNALLDDDQVPTKKTTKASSELPAKQQSSVVDGDETESSDSDDDSESESS